MLKTCPGVIRAASGDWIWTREKVMAMNEPDWAVKLKVFYYKYLWWIWQLILAGVSGFFLYLGISVLRFAYRLNDPFNFILCFFASNLIIMISAVLLIGFVYRMIGVYRQMRKRG